MAAKERVLIYGGNGALGSKCVATFKLHKYWVGSIGHSENKDADYNRVVRESDSLTTQESDVVGSIGNTLGLNKLDAIICVAGGWADGNINQDLTKTAEIMWQKNVWTSIISASLAAKYLKEGGMLILCGASGALNGTPNMIGYGMAKAAVHHLVKSLGGVGNGMPKNAVAAAVLPVLLDTPFNRVAIPESDVSSWTPCDFIANLCLKWVRNEERPSNGSLCKIVTENKVTFVFKTEIAHQFGYYDDNQTVVEVQQRDIYTKDLIGLKTLADKKKLDIITVPGVNHYMWHLNVSIVDNYILKYLD